MTLKSILASVLLLTVAWFSFATAEPTLGNVATHQALLDVGTDLRLMCVAAHPDDEDGATLSMYRKKYGYKTFAVLATRGEGGQNEIGPELYEELAVLRTDEMARASQITGAELHFLNLPEFGYSKSRDETYAIWGEDTALRRMVRAIRELKPDVIITHHAPTGAHGHHQGIGKAVQDAFDVAADPKVFPEQIAEGLEPWQAARLYLRSFRGEGAGTVRIDFNELDPVRGYTYAEIAAQALREHETQGMGFFIDRFLTTRSRAFYGVVKEHAGGTQGGGDVRAPGGALFEGLNDRVSAAARSLSTDGPAGAELRTRSLALVRESVNARDAAWERANRLAAAVTGLRIAAKVNDRDVVPGQTVTVSVEAIDFGEADAKEISYELRIAPWMNASAPEPISETFSADGFSTAQFSVTIPEGQSRTAPHSEFVFEDTFLQPQLTVVAKAMVSGTPIELEAPVLLEIAPSVTIDFVGGPYLVRRGVDRALSLQLLVTNHATMGNRITLRVDGPKGVALDPSSVAVTFAGEEEQKIVPVILRVDERLGEGDYTLRATIEETGHVVEGIVRVAEVKVPEGRKVGVIRSYDDTFVTTLKRLKVPHEEIGIADFTPARLDEFTTIIVDIRAYLVRPDLVANNQALLDYVHRGGTALVMYQKTFEWNKTFAPYDLQVGRGRVTVEDAPITLLVPEHALFTTPNRIVDSDWEGWRQERGLYFPGRWADEYTPLIDVQDPGESIPPGSCLIAEYGEGTYFYTALGWYRQLRELHPGALRVFANMLAL